jgi:hypothetical protein
VAVPGLCIVRHAVSETANPNAHALQVVPARSAQPASEEETVRVRAFVKVSKDDRWKIARTSDGQPIDVISGVPFTAEVLAVLQQYRHVKWSPSPRKAIESH